VASPANWRRSIEGAFKFGNQLQFAFLGISKVDLPRRVRTFVPFDSCERWRRLILRHIDISDATIKALNFLILWLSFSRIFQFYRLNSFFWTFLIIEPWFFVSNMASVFPMSVSASRTMRRQMTAPGRLDLMAAAAGSTLARAPNQQIEPTPSQPPTFYPGFGAQPPLVMRPLMMLDPSSYHHFRRVALRLVP